MSAAVHDAPSHTTDEAGVPGLWEAMTEDLAHAAEVKGARYPSAVGLLDVLSLPGTWAVILFRLANTAHYKGLRPLSRLLYFLNVVLFGAELKPSAVVQPGLVVPHPVGMGWSAHCRIGRRVMLLRGAAIGGNGDPEEPGEPVLGDDVILFDLASVFGPIHIGDRSVVGTRAVVINDVAPDMYVYAARKAFTRPLSEVGLEKHAQAGQHGPPPARSRPSTPVESVGVSAGVSEIVSEVVAVNGRGTKAL